MVLKLLHSENLGHHFIAVAVIMGGDGRVEVVSGKGCSRLFSSSLSSFSGLQPLEPMSPVPSSVQVRSNAPFAGLVICVTGLSKGVDSCTQNFIFGRLDFVSFFITFCPTFLLGYCFLLKCVAINYFKPLAKLYKDVFIAFTL